MKKLERCKLCNGEARIIDKRDFIMGFCLEDHTEGSVEHFFHRDGAIRCMSCGLTLPFFDETEVNRKDNIKFWNGE